MNDRTGSHLFVYAGERISHLTVDSLAQAERLMSHHRRAWYGDVFFDHVRGVVDPDPEPLVEPNPFLLVCHHRDFDWTARHDTTVREFADAPSLIAYAAKLVADEKASGSSNVELWEVYGVRTHERRPRSRRPRRLDDVTARLLEDIRSAPDDDAPRLVWADAVGGERGELVVIQLDLARGGLAPRDAIARKRRQRELLARHGVEWSGLGGIATRCSFHRGFVDAVEMPAPTFLDQADDVAEVAPLVSSLTATGTRDAAEVAALVADPAFAELRGLDISPIDDAGIEVLVASGAFRGLRALGIDVTGPHGPAIRRLFGTRSLHQLERLSLRSYPPDDALIAMLTSGGLPALRSIDLARRQDLAAVARALPAGIVEVRVDDGAGFDELARCPAAATLERLEIYGRRAFDTASFAAFPRLRALSIVVPPVPTIAYAVPPRDIEVSVAKPMPALRELQLDGDISMGNARRVAEKLGAQLELLDLRHSREALRDLNYLKQRVAGELLVGDGTDRPLLRAVPTIQAVWWDHVRLR